MAEEPCPPSGCWWERRDVARRVLSCLASNRDVLACDLVCTEWAKLKAPLPAPVTLQHPAAPPWLARVQRLVLRTDDAATLLPDQLGSAAAAAAAAAALQELQVSECATLEQLPAGLGGLQHLTTLFFHRCPRLSALPEDLASMRQLRQLWLLGTPTSLAEVPPGISALTNLQDLRLHGCHMIQEVPDAIGSLISLTRLELDTDCDSPELLPSLQMPSHLTRISSSIANLTALQHLTLRGANQLEELPDVFGAFSDSLLELRLVGLHALTSLADSFDSLSALTRLELLGANALESLPASIGNLRSLKHLSMVDCHKLPRIPSAIAQLDNLEHLVLGCHSLMEQLPDALGALTALTHLRIETASLPHLPESLGNLGSLRELYLSYCHCLQTLPDSLGGLSSLELLSIDTCMHLVALPDSLTRLTSLRELRLHNAEAWAVQLPALPAGLGHLPQLRSLSLTIQHDDAGAVDDTGCLPALPASLAASTSIREICWGNLHLTRASLTD